MSFYFWLTTRNGVCRRERPPPGWRKWVYACCPGCYYGLRGSEDIIY